MRFRPNWPVPVQQLAAIVVFFVVATVIAGAVIRSTYRDWSGWTGRAEATVVAVEQVDVDTRRDKYDRDVERVLVRYRAAGAERTAALGGWRGDLEPGDTVEVAFRPRAPDDVVTATSTDPATQSLARKIVLGVLAGIYLFLGWLAWLTVPKVRRLLRARRPSDDPAVSELEQRLVAATDGTPWTVHREGGYLVVTEDLADATWVTPSAANALRWVSQVRILPAPGRRAELSQEVLEVEWRAGSTDVRRPGDGAAPAGWWQLTGRSRGHSGRIWRTSRRIEVGVPVGRPGRRTAGRPADARTGGARVQTVVDVTHDTRTLMELTRRVLAEAGWTEPRKGRDWESIGALVFVVLIVVALVVMGVLALLGVIG